MHQTRLKLLWISAIAALTFTTASISLDGTVVYQLKANSKYDNK